MVGQSEISNVEKILTCSHNKVFRFGIERNLFSAEVACTGLRFLKKILQV